MIAKALLTEVRKAKGPIYVEVSNYNDTHLIKAVKSDLIDFLEKHFSPLEETGYTLRYRTFGKDYVNGQ